MQCLSIDSFKSMGWCKKDVTPLLTYWSFVFLALTHRNNLCHCSKLLFPNQWWHVIRYLKMSLCNYWPPNMTYIVNLRYVRSSAVGSHALSIIRPLSANMEFEPTVRKPPTKNILISTFKFEIPWLFDEVYQNFVKIMTSPTCVGFTWQIKQ